MQMHTDNKSNLPELQQPELANRSDLQLRIKKELTSVSVMENRTNTIQTSVVPVACTGRKKRVLDTELTVINSHPLRTNALDVNSGFLCAVTPRRAVRKRSATSDRTFYLLPHCVLTLDYHTCCVGFLKAALRSL
ncbi:uncharacterized protein V6R79_009717 [Siganus canaliculatus]